MKKKVFSLLLFLALALSACNMPTSNTTDTTPPVLQNVNSSAQNVFFNERGCGPTRVTVSVDVSDDSGSLASVGMQYRYRAESNIGASLAWTNVGLPPAGNGHFAGELDVAAEAEPILGQGSGALEYQVYAIDQAGNITTSPSQYAQSISVQRCSGGIANTPVTSTNTMASAPPTPVTSSSNNAGSSSSGSSSSGSSGGSSSSSNNGSSSGNNNSGSGSNNGGSSSGGSNGNDGTLPPAVSLPRINSFDAPATVSTGDSYVLLWDVQDACKVFLNGNEVIDRAAIYTAPATETVLTYTLSAWGAPCDASTEMTAQVTVSITSGGGNNGSGNNGGGNNGGGNTSITIYNNSSHPIVEFLLDGNELIWSEVDSILPGASAPLDGLVTGQTYQYQVGAGFWSGGQKYSIYPLPGGTFTPEDGSITIYDPSVEQIMTQYGSSAQYSGQFWDGTTPGCATFDFYSDGSFNFYVDGVQNDSGWYSLISRNPSAYSVDITIQAGSESAVGTYYYSGAAAGLLYVNNGPAGWETIEYAYNGFCP